MHVWDMSKSEERIYLCRQIQIIFTCKSVASVELILAKFKPLLAFDRGDSRVFSVGHIKTIEKTLSLSLKPLFPSGHIGNQLSVKNSHI